MKHIHLRFGRIVDILGGQLRQRAKGLLTAPHLIHGQELAVLALGDNGLEIQHGANGRRHGADASAASQVGQIVHGEEGLRTALVLFQPRGDLVHGFALPVEFMGLQHQNALRQRNAQGIHHDHTAFGVALQKLLPGGVDILNGAGQLTGKRREQNIPSRGEHGLKVFLISSGRQQRSHRRGPAPHGIKELLFLSVAAQIVKVFLAVHHVRHIDHIQFQFIHKAKGQVGIRVSKERVRIHSSSLCIPKIKGKYKGVSIRVYCNGFSLEKQRARGEGAGHGDCRVTIHIEQ